MRWHIERLDSRTGVWTRLTPTVDGVPRHFRTKREAEAYAYDYGHAGGRNQVSRYIRTGGK